MPHSISAAKRVRQTEKRRLQNRAVASNVRSTIKKFRTMCAEGRLDDARSVYPATVRKIDQAAAKGVLHKNAASRQKSRLAALLTRSAAPAAK